MRTLTSNFNKYAAAAIIYCFSAATPAAAQTFADLPTLQFQTKDGNWGCLFTHSCTVAAPTSLGKS